MDDLANHFWDGCRAGEIRYQVCRSCGRPQFYPRPFCAHDGGIVDWAVSAGRGVVYARTVVHRAPTAEFRPLVPYVLLLVAMDEGFRLMAHGEAGLAIGTRVEVGFREHAGRALPYAKEEA